MTGQNNERRVQFDFEISFLNGGGLQGHDFRLDIQGSDISDSDLSRLIVRDLNLLMVDEVRILNKRVIKEPHKRTLISDSSIASPTNVEYIDLSHTIYDGLITYKGLPAPVICDYLSREASKTHYADGTTFQIGRIEMVGNTGTYLDTPFHRFSEGKDLSEIEGSTL